MVCEWGMSDALGPLTFGKKEEQIFLGREIAQHQDYSEDTAIRIDQEIKKLVMDNFAKAKALLEQNRDTLLKIADELLIRESLDAEQVKALAAGKTLAEPIPASAGLQPAGQEEGRRSAKERPTPIVPTMPKPLPQE
jgi:cell division protease FtsH